MKRACWVALILAVAWSGASAQTGMNTVVKLVETQYAVRHHGVPLLWLAKPFLLGSGVGGLKIAEFEKLRVPAGQAQTLKQQIGEALGPQWSRFLETWSKEGDNWSAIYARPEGRRMRMLIVSGCNDGLSLLQMNVKGPGSRGWFDEPVQHARQVEDRRAGSGQE